MGRAEEPDTPMVALLIRRARVYLRTYREILRADESAFSPNALTGHSVNVPIAYTCQPTKVCAKTCYAAMETMATPNAIRRQARVIATMEAAPRAFARRVVAEYDRLGLHYLRWNGSGDLTPGAVEAINTIGRQRPDVRIWVVSRKPPLAALIEEAPRIYLQLSLDRSSLDRRDAFLALNPRTSRYFFSYQCEKDEAPDLTALRGVSVVYHNRNVYPPGWVADPLDCPICGPEMRDLTCHDCKRCFSGEAVTMREAAEAVAVTPVHGTPT